MKGIPVLHVEADCIARAWELSLIELHQKGCDLKTEYDKPEDPPSKDATMIITITDPLDEPMIHKDFPGGPLELQEYVMEVCDGIKDHLVRDPNDPKDTRWEYTYHQRLFKYKVPVLQSRSTRSRSSARSWPRPRTPAAPRPSPGKSGRTTTATIPPACRASGAGSSKRRTNRSLSMNVRFRSNDAYKAAFMNIFALVQLQQRIAARISELTGRRLLVGRYVHMVDSYHIYGSYFNEFEGRFLGALQKRTFEQRTLRYADMREMMEEAKPAILEKAHHGTIRPCTDMFSSGPVPAPPLSCWRRQPGAPKQRLLPPKQLIRPGIRKPFIRGRD